MRNYFKNSFLFDLRASITVFLVSLPACVGIASLCGAWNGGGMIAGITGGIVTGGISGSHISISGPSGGYAILVIQAIKDLGSYSLFLTAVFFAGCMQILFGILHLGRIVYYIPSSIINGLLVAIGLIFIINQIPDMLGYSIVPDAGNVDYGFLKHYLLNFDIKATIIGISSIVLLYILNNTRKKWLKLIPASIIVVLVGLLMNNILNYFAIGAVNNEMYVNTIKDAGKYKTVTFKNIGIEVMQYSLLLSIALSLESLLSLKATDKMDKKKRHASASRELVGQGVGNMISSIFGGLPITSVVMRSSVNVASGAKTRYSSIMSGIFLLITFLCIPKLISIIPKPAVAAILIMSGVKMIKDADLRHIISLGKQYYLPFLLTVVTIITLNVFAGVIIGFVVGIFFVVRENYVKAFNYNQFKHHYGEMLKIDLPQEISFLNTPSLVRMFDSIPKRSKVIINASSTKYIDTDALDVIRTFVLFGSKMRKIKVSTMGFADKHKIPNIKRTSMVVSKKIQQNITPDEVLELLKEGNKRFVSDSMISHDYKMQMLQVSDIQSPVVVIVSCMDSRAVPEKIFDLGIGDAFIIRIAGNIVNKDIIGSIEYGCHVAGAKLIFILGHTNCGAVNAGCSGATLDNLDGVLANIHRAVDSNAHKRNDNKSFVHAVTSDNVKNAEKDIVNMSKIISTSLKSGKLKISGGIYNITTGEVEFIDG